MKTKSDFKKIIFSSLGAGVEYYDFAIYMVLATAIGSKFFSSDSQLSNTLMVFSVYAAGYLLRPLSAVIFGYIGDKYSRVVVLRATMLIIFLSTLSLALLPSVESIGVSATMLFVILRSIQSLAIGAEIPIAVTYSTENFKHRQGLVTGIIFACLSLGILLTSFIYFVMSEYTSKEFLNDYGWRVAFLIGAIITFCIYLFRKSITESEEFISNKGVDKETSMNFCKKIVVGIMLVAGVAMLVTQFYMFLPSYCTEFMKDTNVEVSSMLLIGSIVMTPACLLGGFISDYVSKRKMMGIILVILLALVPLFYKSMVEGRDVIYIFMTISLLMGLLAPTYNVIIKDFFSPSYRCRGLAVSYNFGYLIFSTPMPIVTILLIQKYSNIYAPSYMVIIAILVSLIGLVLSRNLGSK